MKRTPRIRKDELAFPVETHVKEKRRGDSEIHTAWIRKQPCIVTGHGGSIAHHLLRVPHIYGDNRGMALKELDIFTVPLDEWKVHKPLHDGPLDEEAFFLDKGIPNVHLVALNLAKRSPDPDIRAFAKELLKR